MISHLSKPTSKSSLQVEVVTSQKMCKEALTKHSASAGKKTVSSLLSTSQTPQATAKTSVTLVTTIPRAAQMDSKSKTRCAISPKEESYSPLSKLTNPATR